MNDKKIVITYGSSGAGHKIACEAIKQALLKAGFKGELKIMDIVEYMPGIIGTVFSKGYLWMVTKAPWLWYGIYEHGSKLSKFTPPPPWQNALLSMVLRKVKHRLIHEKPDYIISTHFTASWLAGRYKYLHNPGCKLATVVTDYGLHPSWICPNHDLYFVPNDSDRIELSRFNAYTGVVQDNIHDVGIPVLERFTGSKDKQALRRKHGFSTDKFTILIIGGAYGFKHIEVIIENLIQCRNEIQIIVAARKVFKLNDNLNNKLSDVGIPVYLFGMIDFLDELMALSDIAITKTGGLTSTECINSGCPLFIYQPYPGQEERNASLFSETQAGWRIYQLESLAFKIDKLAANPELHHRMIKATAQVAKPDAAKNIAELVLADLYGGQTTS